MSTRDKKLYEISMLPDNLPELGHSARFSFSGSFFSSCVTIDPAEVSGAWDRLETDLFAEHVSSIPHLAHSSLAHALIKKAKDARE